MNDCTEEETTTRPAVDVVEFLVAVAGTENRREQRVLRSEEEEDR